MPASPRAHLARACPHGGRCAGETTGREACETGVRWGAAGVGARRARVTGTTGSETGGLQAPPTAGRRVALTRGRHAGPTPSGEGRVGKSIPRDPPFTLE